MTMKELAERADTTQATISRTENGKADPERKTLIAIAKALGENFGLDWLEEHVNGNSVEPSRKEIAKDLSAQELISLKFGGGDGKRTSNETRTLAKLLDEAIAKDERVRNSTEYKPKE